MLTRIDRIQLAVPDRTEAAAGWVGLLGAEHDGDDKVAALAATRSRYRLGDGWVEFLEPDGAGPVAEAVARRGGHLFAGGVATRDLDGLVRRIEDRGGPVVVEGGHAYVGPEATGEHGLRLVISPDQPQPAAGAIDFFYEVSNLVEDASATTDAYTELLGLDRAAFVAISSRPYGYRGTLTLFDPDGLDRLEVITPDKPGTTMYRFFERFGESLYMAFAEAGDLPAIEQRLAEAGAACTPVRNGDDLHTLFVHPPALGGMMLGLSRRTYAWTWSGHPERVEPAGR